MSNIIVAASAEILAEAKGLMRPEPVDGVATPVPAVLFPALNTLSAETAGALTFDGELVRGLFKTFAVGSIDFQVSSFYTELAAEVLADFQMLEDTYPENFAIMGIWDEESGAQLRPVSPLFINFMPDVYDYDEDVYNEATVLTDVNLLAGQAPRDFS